MPVRGKPSALGIYLRPNNDSSVRVGSLYRDPNGAITFTDPPLEPITASYQKRSGQT